MIKRNNLVYNTSSINEYGVDKNIKQPIQVVVKDVILINDYKLNIIYNNGATKNIELINNSIKKFEYVSEGNKIIIETNNNDKFEIEIPNDGSKWELVEGLLRTKEGTKITLQDINEIDSVLGAENIFLNKKGNFKTPIISHSEVTDKNAEPNFQHVTQEEKNKLNSLTNYTHPSKHPTSILEGVDTELGAEDRFLNKKGGFVALSHTTFGNKNGELKFQHVDTTITKETLVEDDKVTIYDSETGKVVLTNKNNVGGGIENTDILYADLLALISNNELVPNSSYRITNYTTTTAQTNTQSAGHDFDIMVTALSSNELSEYAKCVRKSGDTYFASAKLEAWEIKYCINNDTTRFDWADAVNGKGVIYYMKDEWNNECPYDFKNIQFKKSEVFLYTFGGTTDDSLTGGCHHNTMMDYISSSVLTLNFNTFGTGCYNNTFGINCYFNTFGSYCKSNKFGDSVHNNTFGDSCYYNTFGSWCYSNTFGIGCYSNTFDNDCQNNTFGDDCYSNSFGIDCYFNTFGNYCASNTFGNICSSNNFYTGTSGTIKKNYIRYIVLEDECSYNNFYSSLITSSLSYLQRIRIKGLQNTSATNTQITLSETNTKYEWVIAGDSSGVIKQYCPEDSLNNYTYKIENTTVSTWAASTAYAGYVYQAQINIANLSEADSVNVVFGVNEAISGNYAPAIEIYSGYILVFAKVDTAIIIPTIEITKI